MIELDIESGASAQTPSCSCSVPEVVLPGQFYATVRSQRAGERERLLMLAVLEDAITCYQRYARARGPAGRQLFEDARAWLESEDRSVLFSFESICDALEISPGFVRRRLHDWEAQHAPPPRPVRSVAAEPGRRSATARRGAARAMRHATGQGRSVASLVERA